MAFEKTQNNFTELYTTGLVAGVNTINAGPGISVSATTGTVNISANLNQIKFVSNSLVYGINTPFVSNAIVYTNSADTLNIDTNPNVFSSNTFQATGGGLANLNGTLTTAAALQPNLAQAPNLVQVGNLNTLTVVGSIVAGNAQLGNVVVANYYTGTLATPLQPNITQVGTLSNLAVTGNISAANFVGGNFIGTLVGAVDTVSNAAQPNITSLGTLTSLTVSGNITAGNANLGNTATANFYTGDGSLLTGVQAVTANTVANSAQPNITSVGPMSSLNVVGTLNFGNISATTLLTVPAVNTTVNYKIPIAVRYPNGVSKTMYICLTDQP